MATIVVPTLTERSPVVLDQPRTSASSMPVNSRPPRAPSRATTRKFLGRFVASTAKAPAARLVLGFTPGRGLPWAVVSVTEAPARGAPADTSPTTTDGPGTVPPEDWPPLDEHAPPTRACTRTRAWADSAA